MIFKPAQLAKPLTIFLVLLISAFNLFAIYEIKQKRTQIDHAFKHEEINFWSEVIKQNGSYRDAYLRLSQYYQANGNKDVAYIYLKKAHLLDPNNEEVKGAYSEVSSF